jgi:hypothetical protein
MQNIQIIPNIVPKSFQDQIEQVFLSDYFAWYYSPSTVGAQYDLKSVCVDPNSIDSAQMVHNLNTQNRAHSEYSGSVVKPILLFLEDRTGLTYKNIVRAKSNLLFQNPIYNNTNYTIPHTDAQSSNFKTLLYYVNNSDGDTTFFNEICQDTAHTQLTIDRKITPKKGSAVLFDSNIFHCSKPPQHAKSRIVINIILEC